MKNPKKGIRWLFFRVFGPPELKNLMKYINKISKKDLDIAAYPMGEFPFIMKISNEDNQKPIIFPTSQERAAFLRGLQLGIGIIGDSAQLLTREQFNEMEEMEKRATHNDRKTRLN